MIELIKFVVRVTSSQVQLTQEHPIVYALLKLQLGKLGLDQVGKQIGRKRAGWIWFSSLKFYPISGNEYFLN